MPSAPDVKCGVSSEVASVTVFATLINSTKRQKAGLWFGPVFLERRRDWPLLCRASGLSDLDNAALSANVCRGGSRITDTART